jgi:membrane protein YqaA with SNARE-associated domain
MAGIPFRSFSGRLIRDARLLTPKQRLMLVGGIAGFLIVSLGLYIGAKLLLDGFNLPKFENSWAIYLAIFLVFLISNLSLFIPVPFALTILLVTAPGLNPIIIGFSASLGASLGELSGYFAGMLGRKALTKETFMCSIDELFCNSTISHWVETSGPFAIGILAAQPILPFDIAGIVAGSLKMRLRVFFIAVLTGKTIKYVALSTFAGLIPAIPFIN